MREAGPVRVRKNHLDHRGARRRLGATAIDGNNNTAIAIGNSSSAFAGAGDGYTATILGINNSAFAGVGNNNAATTLGNNRISFAGVATTWPVFSATSAAHRQAPAASSTSSPSATASTPTTRNDARTPPTVLEPRHDIC
jgi:hypothetical protein